jgi:hypothetical protein
MSKSRLLNGLGYKIKHSWNLFQQLDKPFLDLFLKLWTALCLIIIWRIFLWLKPDCKFR